MSAVGQLETQTWFEQHARAKGFAFDLRHCQKRCVVATIRTLLQLSEETRGKQNNRDVAITLMDYICHPDRRWFLHCQLPFLHTVVEKLVEFTKEPAFKRNEPMQWLTQLYADIVLRPHLQLGAGDSKKEFSVAGMLVSDRAEPHLASETLEANPGTYGAGGVDEPHEPCACMNEVAPRIATGAFDEPEKCVACEEAEDEEEALWPRETSDPITCETCRKPHIRYMQCYKCERQYCVGCTFGMPGDVTDCITGLLVFCVGCRPFTCARHILKRRNEAGFNARQAYENLCERSPGTLPPWYLAIEYDNHDGTFGPFEDPRYCEE